MFETADGLSLNFWYQRQKSQYQSQFFRPFYKVSVLVSKFDTNSKSLSLSIKNWDQLHWVSVSTYKIWSRTSLFFNEIIYSLISQASPEEEKVWILENIFLSSFIN